MQNGGDITHSIQLLKPIKLNVLLYLLIQKLQENIKHRLKIIFCSLYQQFNWQIISPDALTVSNHLSNGLFSSPTRAARVTSREPAQGRLTLGGSLTTMLQQARNQLKPGCDLSLTSIFEQGKQKRK